MPPCSWRRTTLRSVVGKIELDKTFLKSVKKPSTPKLVLGRWDEKAAKPWAVKRCLRYEIGDIELPGEPFSMLWKSKDARPSGNVAPVVASPKGEREARINVSEGISRKQIQPAEAEQNSVRSTS